MELEDGWYLESKAKMISRWSNISNLINSKGRKGNVLLGINLFCLQRLSLKPHLSLDVNLSVSPTASPLNCLPTRIFPLTFFTRFLTHSFSHSDLSLTTFSHSPLILHFPLNLLFSSISTCGSLHTLPWLQRTNYVLECKHDSLAHMSPAPLSCTTGLVSVLTTCASLFQKGSFWVGLIYVRICACAYLYVRVCIFPRSIPSPPFRLTPLFAGFLSPKGKKGDGCYKVPRDRLKATALWELIHVPHAFVSPTPFSPLPHPSLTPPLYSFHSALPFPSLNTLQSRKKSPLPFPSPSPLPLPQLPTSWQTHDHLNRYEFRTRRFDSLSVDGSRASTFARWEIKLEVPLTGLKSRIRIAVAAVVTVLLETEWAQKLYRPLSHSTCTHLFALMSCPLFSPLFST